MGGQPFSALRAEYGKGTDDDAVPALVPVPVPVAVEVSFNGLDYTHDGGVQWRWLLPPRALALSPSSGPAQGNTIVVVRAEHVWDVPALRCRFGETVVNSTIGTERFHVVGSSHRELELTLHRRPAGAPPRLAVRPSASLPS